MDSLSFFNISNILPYVLPAILPGEWANAVHFIILPHALIIPAVGPWVMPIAIYFIFLKLPLKLTAIEPSKVSKSVFTPQNVVSLELCPIRPDFLSAPVLLVELPLTGVFHVSWVDISAEAVRLMV